MSVQSFTLYDMLVRNARAFGNRTALLDDRGRRQSFAQTRERVDALASGLYAAGIRPGDRLCILALNSIEFVELYFACARLGSIAYPVNWRLKPEEIARLLERARPKAFLVDAPNLGGVPDRDSSAAGGIEHWIRIDGVDAAADAAGFIDLDDLYLDTPLDATPEVDPDDPVAIIATAAVEAIPRGAMLSHRNLLAADVLEIASLGLTPEDGSLVALPLFHIAGLGHALSFLHAGGCNAILPRFDAKTAVEMIDRHALTHLTDFPPVLTQLLDAAEEAGSKLESLRHVTGLDAPATIERLEQSTGAKFWTGFGQCETSGFVTLQRFAERPGAAGRPGELCLVELVDDLDREVPTGTPGEIVVRGPLVFRGYADEPEVTAHTFRNGWHHTGDVGRFDEDGYLWYVKRKPEKELIKPGGENVYPAEVESVIAELDGVTGVCVFGVPHPKWGEGIKAAVEIEEGCTLDAEQVIEHVGDRIARYKKPHFVVFTDALPRDDDGAVDRDAVKELYAVSDE